MKYRHIIFSTFIGWLIIFNSFCAWALYYTRSINGTMFGCKEPIPDFICLKMIIPDYFVVLFSGPFHILTDRSILPCILFGVALVLFNTKTKFRNSMLIAVGIAYLISIFTINEIIEHLWFILALQVILHIIFLIGLIPFWKFKIDVKIGKFFVGLFRRISFNHRFVKG